MQYLLSQFLELPLLDQVIYLDTYEPTETNLVSTQTSP